MVSGLGLRVCDFFGGFGVRRGFRASGSAGA